MSVKTVYYDRYGGYQGENPAPPIKKLPYMVKDVGGGVKFVIYTPPDVSGNTVVERITKASADGVTTTTVEHGFGSWENPDNITFYPINEAIPVEIEEA